MNVNFENPCFSSSIRSERFIIWNYLTEEIVCLSYLKYSYSIRDGRHIAFRDKMSKSLLKNWFVVWNWPSVKVRFPVTVANAVKLSFLTLFYQIVNYFMNCYMY